MKYKSKTISINAFQFTGEDINPPKWFLKAHYAGNAFVTMSEKYGYYITITYDGDSHKARIGDWIIYSNDKLSVCRDTDFKERFVKTDT